jgi:hypothetical protein
MGCDGALEIEEFVVVGDYIDDKAENKFLQLLPCPTSAAMDCVFHVYMQQ